MPLNLEVLDWLLAGDSAVQFQARRDLLGDERPDLQRRIPHDGDAAAILAAQRGDGHWGEGSYQPKWTCTHYSLLELRDLAVPSGYPSCVRAVSLLVGEKGADGGVNPSRSVKVADVCINGHSLAYASHFGVSTVEVASVVDFVLGQELPDGGFNCRSNRSGARNSSVHTTASVIDGFAEYLRRGHTHRADEVRGAMRRAADALLARRLYQRRSDGEPIRAEFTRLHHPARWYFDVLRGLEVLRAAGVAGDSRCAEALGVLGRRRLPDGRWAATSQYPGRTHVAYPPAGTPNRWVTLRALRVLRHFHRE